ncbi:uncharacterized protein LOC129624595 isoform X11 [Bubalus kerabau]|uniref:uncharacterized protein LOC129624595 isoform X11 n=1 Tax=Bubalus carabanensis TaxID=3119969 RepID=UPI00244EB420|nr:uncharacterized protein LOC129624595 isoform X11 [Bubalus carabanensis]
MVCDRDLSHHMGEDATRVQAAEGHTQLGILAQTEKKEGSITYPLLTQPSRGQLHLVAPFPGAAPNYSVHSCPPSRTQICLEDERLNDKQVDGRNLGVCS